MPQSGHMTTQTCDQCGQEVTDPYLHFEHRPVHEVTQASDVDQDVLDLAEHITDGWYSDGPIDWEDTFDRMEGMEPWDEGPLKGWALSLGPEYDSPAMRKIQREIRKMRRAG